jgi:hypothetical protein
VVGATVWAILAGRDEPAVLAIKRLKGKITRDESAEGKPVVAISFKVAGPAHLPDEKELTDADLAELQPHLEALSKLQDLDLRGAKITNDGLRFLETLTQLKTLQLGGGWETNVKLTRNRVDELRKALPHTEIVLHESREAENYELIRLLDKHPDSLPGKTSRSP